jgi:hypothetical protein
LDEALKMKGGRAGFTGQPGTFRLLLELMLETGMQVSDAIRFDPSAIQRGDSLWIYTYEQQKRKKTSRPKPNEAYLSDRLKTAIEGCSWSLPSDLSGSEPRATRNRLA